MLNPIFMVPYVLNALLLTAGDLRADDVGLIRRPFINVPWTTPPILGHYLVTGGDWRAAVWGAVSIAMAMAVYYPFARVATARPRTFRPRHRPACLHRSGSDDVRRQ